MDDSMRPLEQKQIQDNEEENMKVMAMRKALEALKNLPGGPLSSPEEAMPQDDMQMAQVSDQEAQDAIQRMYESQGLGNKALSPAPEAPEALAPQSEEPGMFKGPFGGKSTRQKQLDELEKKAKGE